MKIKTAEIACIIGMLIVMVLLIFSFQSIKSTEIINPEPAIYVQQESLPAIESNAESNFNKALKVVYEHEGYISDDKEDKGGYTKWGISFALLEAEHLDIDGDGDVDIDDVKALTKEKTRHIYYDLFWKRHNYDEIKDFRLATKLFDMAVNMGGSRANKILKTSLGAITDEEMYITGILDPETIDLINEVEPVVLLDELRKEQADFYLALIKKNPQYIKFKNGWLNRAAW